MKNTNSLTIALAVTFATVAVSSAAQATIFTSRDSYVAANATSQDVTFNGLVTTGDFTVLPSPFQIGDLTISSPQNQVVDKGFLGTTDDVLFVDSLFATTTFTFAQPATAVGFALANYGIFDTDTITASIFNGKTRLTKQTFSVSDVTNGFSFFGVNGLGSITSVQLTPADKTFPDFLVVGEVLSTSAAVPEPASWALMIGGFGLAGAVLRRRRTAFA